MAQSVIEGVRIAGIASAVPSQTNDAQAEVERFGAEVTEKIAKSVGVQSRRIASAGMCASDLCASAAERLLEELQWSREEIRGLIFITQSPDYVLPATSHTLHERLKLPTSCGVFDLNLGSSGYVYGLWLASMMASSLGGKILLLAGDTSSRMISPEDQSLCLLFGDAGTATGIEPAPGAGKMHFELGADGTGWRNLIVPAGGFRNPRTKESAVRQAGEDGNARSQEDLFMDGAEIFTFTLRRVPPLVEAVLKAAGAEKAEIDFFVFHQANRFILEHLAKKMKLPLEKVIIGLEQYGNTSSASIPLAITTSDVRQRIAGSASRALLAGFGPGFSWAGGIIDMGSTGVFGPVEC